ncbi:hypothetical protein BST81_24655 [Leptolyngbya sp. 'hensonii']|nr:hypothetical protein BST81_24655 [Leptolyngbya sp. 'hensonii']
MCTVATLSATSVALGLIPSLPNFSTPLTFSTQALAQTVTDAELKSYARAVLTIEPLRQAAYSEIKKIVGSGDIPTVTCNKKDSLNNLPKSTRSIAIKYCNRSKKIVEESGLTIARFNAITVKVQEDPELEKRVQAELIRLQKPTTTL